MIFGLPADRLVEQRCGSPEKQQLLQQFLAVQQQAGGAQVTWGSDGHLAVVETVQALKDGSFWHDPDVQEVLRLQDLGLPALTAAAHALAQETALTGGNPLAPARELAQRFVEWRADALPLLPELMARFVDRTAGVDPLGDPAGEQAVRAAAAEMSRLVETDPYWLEVAAEFRETHAQRLKPLSVWARSHLVIEI